MVTGFFFILGLVLCVLLNLLVIAVLLKSNEINYMGFLMISLAVSDLLQGGIGYSIEIHSYCTNEQISDKSCKIAAFVVTFLGIVSISHLAGIAVERHIVLRYPLRMRALRKKPIFSLYVIIPSWIYGFLWALFPVIGWSRYNRQPGLKHSCAVDVTSTRWQYTSYSYNLLFWCFLLPICIIIYCSYSIYSSLNVRGRRSSTAVLSMGDEARDSRKSTQRQYSIMSLVMIGAFLGAWSPYAGCVLVLTVKGLLPSILLSVASIFAKSSCLHNPIIFFLFLKEFRMRCYDFLASPWKLLFMFSSTVCKVLRPRLEQSKLEIPRKQTSRLQEAEPNNPPRVDTIVFSTLHNVGSANL